MLEKICKRLYEHYGDLGWWPADTVFEVMVGAVLTQNTAWTNVEKAIDRFEGDLSPERIMNLPLDELQDIIRPSGFYRQKSLYLKALTRWFMDYGCDIDLIKSYRLDDIRPDLLKVKGVGEETADSILLYGFDFPTFVVDAYTRRLFTRFPLAAGKTYSTIQSFCQEELPRDPDVYKHVHALIVQNAKVHCKKKPVCEACPLEDLCEKKID